MSTPILREHVAAQRPFKLAIPAPGTGPTATITPIPSVVQRYTLDTILDDESIGPATTKIIWRNSGPRYNHPENEDLVQIAENAINIIGCKKIKHNVRMSLALALDLASSQSQPTRPEEFVPKRVLYLNSYASLPTLKEMLQSEMTHHPGERAELSQRVSILAFSMGMLAQCADAAREAIYIDKKIDDNADADSERERLQYHDVVVVNSLEFAAISYADRLKFVTSILEWYNAAPVTIVIFTQEIHPGMLAGYGGRGPMGMLTSSAEQVSTLFGVDGGDVRNGLHEPNAKIKVKLFYSPSGGLCNIEFGRGYKGPLSLAQFPKELIDHPPDGIDIIEFDREEELEW